MINSKEENYFREKVRVKIREKKRISKNIFVLSLAFMLHFTSYQGIANLQSSINAEHGLGTKALSAIYATIAISCIFLPTFVIRRLTAKWTIVFCMSCYIPFLILQLYPKFVTLLPAGILLGLGAGPMWAAQSTYLTQLAQVYGVIGDKPVGGIIVQFFGVFFLAWQTAELSGNLISSSVLSHSGGAKSTDLKTCGANFCNADAEKLHRPPDAEIFKLTIIYLSCIFSAILVLSIFLDPLRRYGEKRKGSSSANTGFNLLLATLRQTIKKKQLLLMPITIWIGIEQSFIGADFTRSYIACALGVDQIGYVMICFGVLNASCSILFGSIMKYIGRIPIIALGAIVHLTIVTFMLFWRPQPTQRYIFFVMAGLWGVGDAVWQTQINGLYGLLFRRNKEAAFSNYRLWESTGFAIGYCLDIFCTRIKIYVLLIVLSLGLLGYIICEYKYIKKQNKLLEMDSRLHSNASIFEKQSFIANILYVPEIAPSHHINSGEAEDDEIDELEEDVIILDEDPTPAQSSKS